MSTCAQQWTSLAVIGLRFHLTISGEAMKPPSTKDLLELAKPWEGDLLEAITNPNYSQMQKPGKRRNKNGRTLLARACGNNDLPTAKLRLTERPKDLNLPDNAGNTPLQIAALQGYVEIVKFLLNVRQTWTLLTSTRIRHLLMLWKMGMSK
jgi:hypothetical protein